MFPEIREVLMYLLGILVVVMAILLVLILRKRLFLPSLPGKGEPKPEEPQPEGPAPEPPEEERGPDDLDAIKKRLGADLLPVTRDVGSPEPPVPEPPGTAIFSAQKSVPQPGPETKVKPVFQDDEIEEGVVLGEQQLEEALKPAEGPEYVPVEEPAEEKPEPKPMKEKELIAKGIVKPGEEKGIIARLVPRKAPPVIKALKPEKGVKPEEASPDVAFEKAVTVDSSEISKDTETFLGQTVAIEGEIQLSSKGIDDFWYVFFDKGGSSVVRCKENLPFNKCRLFVKVERTKLGQIYLDVVRYKKL
ncbi:MAG: hypothetical protein JSV63_03220 [Candidatus Aenigmatarchaeota archaeon]|nr:MAG: hypothetical protein JSV63_03220 [Candidatus Aenigmarchaeota archaeon]